MSVHSKDGLESVSWRGLVDRLNPQHFLTLTAPDKLFEIQDGKRTITASTASKRDIFLLAVRDYLLKIARLSRQHLRFLYEIEMEPSIYRKAQAPHVHGYLVWEFDDDNKTFQNALAQKYKMMSAGGYKGKHPDKVESFQTSYPLGDVKTYEPWFSVEDGLDLCWMDFMNERFGVYVPYHPEGFKKYSRELSGATYTFRKHASDDGSELVMDLCPRTQHKCNKKGRDCRHEWSHNTNGKIVL